MGAKESKCACITYEDAIKRVNVQEFKRLKEAFKRNSSQNAYISKLCFTKDVLGDYVPPTLAEYIYANCGGTVKGIAFKELLCGLVLITRGTPSEKSEFLFNLYSNENGTHISKVDFQKFIFNVECVEPSTIDAQAMDTLFENDDKVSHDQFSNWIKSYKNGTSLSRWLFSENNFVSLNNELDMPTFYQTLAGVTHLEEADIIDLEKVYWNLKEQSKSGKLDLETLLPMVSPPLPLNVCESFFNVFDENRDGHIDFKEMACGISAACRGPLTERQKFCFKMFDVDHDGFLSDDEVKKMVDILLFVYKENSRSDEIIDEEVIMEDIKSHKSGTSLTVEEYVIWTVHNNVSMDFLDLIYQVMKRGRLNPMEFDRKFHSTGGNLFHSHNLPTNRTSLILKYVHKLTSEKGAAPRERLIALGISRAQFSAVTLLKDLSPPPIYSAVCHIVLGLKPVSRQEENKIVCGWLLREDRRGYLVGQFWCLVAIEWWHVWQNYVTSPMKSSSTYPSMTFGKGSSETGCSHSMTFLPANLSESFSNQSAALYNTHKGAPARPGPIDNSSLIVSNSCKVSSLTGEGGKLKNHLKPIQDYALVPDSLWKALKRWYGASLYIPRQVIRTSDGGVDLELYPITLLIFRHQTQSTVASRLTHPQSSSWSGVAAGYGAAALSATNYSYTASANAVPKRYLAHTATFSRLATIRHVYNYLCNRLKIGQEDVRLWQFYDETNMTLIEEEDSTLENLRIRDDDQVLLEIRNKDLTWPEEIGSMSANLAEKQNKQTPMIRGTTGLNNLGNTCFMNAALQSVINTQPLTMYFLRNMHLYELNRTNLLGMKGQVAKRYGDLVQDIWSGSFKTIAPIKLRLAISKHAPQFNGFQQHDSQELLSFLLDGLHEDLNRVYDKPYLQKKDSECRPDVAVAQEAWENHILRNKSIIVDLFHGQLKSKVTCKTCGHESVTFDPFNYLSLPLPMESYIYIQCIVIKLNGTVPMKFSLRLNAEDVYATVKQHLSQRCGVPCYLLKLVQISESNIKIVFTDDQKVTQNPCNVYYAYELPVNGSSSGSISGDEERLSITSIRSTHREAAQTFTMIQRSVRPGNSGGQVRTISEDSTDSHVNSSSGGELCCSESSESTSSPADCSEILLEDMSGRLTVDSGHCSASSASLADSTDTTNGASQQPSYIVAIHRKMIRQDVYFVSSQKSKPSLFGFPVIVPCQESTTHTELYQSVWLQVARFVSPLPPSETTILNHATDCDDSLGYEFPFLLKAVTKDGMTCAWCPWYRFCRGCVIPCNEGEFSFSSNHIAIDWDPTALHLRYQTSQESEYECIGEQFNQKSSEPLDVTSCLEAFITEEHLSDAEKYCCSKCKGHQPASKKLQIWRLPPILIIHLKRFQPLNEKWIKSQKVVKFPFNDFDLTDYLAAVPRETIYRYRELKQRMNKKLKDHSNDDYVSNVIVTPVTTDECVDAKPICNGGLKTDVRESCESYKENRNTKKFSDSGSDDMCQKRKRLESTSLSRTPIDDTALQDFHQHRLKNEETTFDLKYNLYSVVTHSGILGGGHYVSYANNPNGKWYCYNDSSCREVNQDMDTSCAYMLFYERQGLDYSRYMPNVNGKNPLDIGDQDSELESDYKKMCHLM